MTDKKDLLRNVLTSHNVISPPQPKIAKVPIESDKLHELKEIQKELTKLREQTDFTPILKELREMKQWLIKILDKVDLTDEEQEVLDMLKLELQSK